MIVSPSIIIINSTDKTTGSTMTNTTTCNPSQQTTTINQFARFQSLASSFRNGALFIGGRKATKEDIAKAATTARAYLANLINSSDCIEYRAARGEEIKTVNQTCGDLGISLYVPRYTF